MTKQEYLLYENIDFYHRYNSFRIKYKGIEPTLENYEVDKVLNVFKEIGYEKVRFMKSTRFFKIIDKQKPFEFYFHISLKYGICELIMGGKNTDKSIFVGGVYGNIMRDIIYYKSEEEKRFPLPAFGNYTDLRIILKEALFIYEDFKIEFIKQYS